MAALLALWRLCAFGCVWFWPALDWCHVTRVYFSTFFFLLPSFSVSSVHSARFPRSVRLFLCSFFSSLVCPTHTLAVCTASCLYTSRHDLNIYVTPQRSLLPVPSIRADVFFSSLFLFSIFFYYFPWRKEKRMYLLWYNDGKRHYRTIGSLSLVGLFHAASVIVWAECLLDRTIVVVEADYQNSY